MKAGWRECYVGDLLDVHYGKDHKKLADGEIPAYGSAGLMRYVERPLSTIPAILIPRKGTLNNVMYSMVPFWTVDTMFWCTIKDSYITDLKFLYYWLCLVDFLNLNVGSAVPSTTVPTIQGLQISLPPLAEQKRIAAVLGALDDKIELNRKMNENLEAQAQALFKSWFVDFEPFGGKMPKEWKKGQIGDFCKTVLGGTPSRAKKEYWGGDVAWINSGKVNDFRIVEASEMITEEGLRRSAAKLLPKKTTVLAITGATLGQVSLLEIEAAANQSVIGILESGVAPYTFVYPYIVNSIQRIILKQTGGAQQHINKDNVDSFEMYVPDESILTKYDSNVRPVYELIAKNVFESRKLAETRDALLPKLMKGSVSAGEPLRRDKEVEV